VETIISFVRVLVVAVITGLLAAGTWLRCRFESLLVLLPGRAADRPGRRKRIGQIRPGRARVTVAVK
jgi:hypothetical protein